MRLDILRGISGASQPNGVFARLRERRKELAAKEGLPAFAVCTDEQLAAMAKLERPDRAALKRIEGFGEGKAEKYAEALLAVMGSSDNPPPDVTTAAPPDAPLDSGEPAPELALSERCAEK